MSKREGRSPTARRIWLWLDEADPSDAATLAAYRRLQESLPPRVRAGLLRAIFAEGLARIEGGLKTGGSPTKIRKPKPAVVASPGIPVAGENRDNRQRHAKPADPVDPVVDSVKPEEVASPRDEVSGGLMW